MSTTVLNIPFGTTTYRVTIKSPYPLTDTGLKALAREAAELLHKANEVEQNATKLALTLTPKKPQNPPEQEWEPQATLYDSAQKVVPITKDTPLDTTVKARLKETSRVFASAVQPGLLSAPEKKAPASILVKPTLSSSEATPQVLGIINPGCNCFMNALLQSLLSSKSSMAWLENLAKTAKRCLKGNPHQSLNNDTELKNLETGLSPSVKETMSTGKTQLKTFIEMTQSQAADILMVWLADYKKGSKEIEQDSERAILLRMALVKLMSRDENGGISQNISFVYTAQCDPQEFLLFLADLGDRLNVKPPFFYQSYTYTNGHASQITVTNVTLPISYLPVTSSPRGWFSRTSKTNIPTLQDSLDEAYNSPSDSSPRECLRALPDMLWIQVKCFNVDPDTGITVKKPQVLPVREDFTCELTEYPQESLPPDKQPIIRKHYTIDTVICHIGNSAQEGHYVSYVLKEGQWYCFSDTLVRPVDPQTVQALFNNPQAHVPYLIGLKQI